LRVQRDLYPEGAGTCHTIVVHPPGGIAGGDSLTISAKIGLASAALLTTPGAGKWYRTNARPASQALEFEVADDASMEWLPQETILFDGAVAEMRTTVKLEGTAAYTGWEVLCFGREASGHKFASGLFSQQTTVVADGELLWSEKARVAGNDPLFSSPVGFAGHSVCATMLAAGPEVTPDVLARCRGLAAGAGALSGITRLPRLVIARWLGDSSEDARRYFVSLWKELRPSFRRSAAIEPRIWST
jgi:urease accessory protein